MHSRSSLENHTFSDRNCAKTIPFNLPSNLKNVALAYEPSVEKKIELRTFQKMILYRFYRSLDRAIGGQTPRTSPLDPPLHHQKGDLLKRKTPGVEIKLEHHFELCLEPRSLCDWCRLVYLVSFY